jgi:hypothetical protein
MTVRKLLFVNTDGNYEENGTTDQAQFQQFLISTAGGLAGIGIDMNGSRVVNAADAINPQDLVTLSQLQAAQEGLDVKLSVNCATVADLGVDFTYAYAGGISTLTSALVNSALNSPLASNFRVLVKNQANPFENGIYDVSGVGTAIVLTRSIDADSQAKLNANAFTFIEDGTVNQDQGWVMTSSPTAIAWGQSSPAGDIVWTQFSSKGVLLAGKGINIDLVTNYVDVNRSTNSALAFDSAGAHSAIRVKLAGQAENAAATAQPQSGLQVVAGALGGLEIQLGTDPGLELAASGLRVLDNQFNLVKFTAGENLAEGDVVYISANNTVMKYTTLTASSVYPIGVAMYAVLSGAQVDVALSGMITRTGATYTAGTKLYWSGSIISTTMPGGPGSNVVLVGYAKNATDIYLDVRVIKKNA